MLLLCIKRIIDSEIDRTPPLTIIGPQAQVLDRPTDFVLLVDNGILNLWPSGKQCMTKPKQGVRQRFHRLPRWQRLSVKILIVLLIVGAIVGIGVGISIRVHGGVYQSANQQATIPS